jgi:hypothetical protein
MPELNPSDPLKAIGKIKAILAGGKFKVISTAKKRNTPWYNVTVYDSKGKASGTGWINSIALIGQTLRKH